MTAETQAPEDAQEQDMMPFWRAVLHAPDMTDTERVRHLSDTCQWYGDILNYVQVALDRGDVEAATACLRNPYQCLGEASVPLPKRYYQTVDGSM